MSGGMEQCVYREAAECCVRSLGVRMIPPSGRTKALSYDALNNVCQLVQNDLCVCCAQEVSYVVGSRATYVSRGAET